MFAPDATVCAPDLHLKLVAAPSAEHLLQCNSTRLLSLTIDAKEHG